MWLDGRGEPGLESITVWLQSHRLQDGLSEERVSTDEADNTEEKKETTEAKGDPATVSGRFLVATSFKYFNEMKTWRSHSIYLSPQLRLTWASQI